MKEKRNLPSFNLILILLFLLLLIHLVLVVLGLDRLLHFANDQLLQVLSKFNVKQVELVGQMTRLRALSRALRADD